MDHLGGIEFLEKVDDLSKVIVKEHYKNQIKNSKKQIANSLITKLEYALIN
jgi:hypothetical protein